jgi:hypothetical protein
MRSRLALQASLLVLASTAHAGQTQPFPPPPPPDLRITAYAITSPAVIHCGQQTIVIQITETNSGAGPAGPYVTAHTSNGVGFCFQFRPGLAAGTSATFTDVCNLNNGSCPCAPIMTYTIPFHGQIDAGSQVSETNEGNNLSVFLNHPAQCP